MHKGNRTSPCLEVGIEWVGRTEVVSGRGCLQTVCRRTIAGSIGRGGVGAGGRCWEVTAIEIVGSIGAALVHERLGQRLGDLGTLVHLVTVGQIVRSIPPTVVATAAARALRRHHLASDTTSVGGLSDGRQNWADGVHDVLPGFWVREIHGRLDNVVGK